MSTMTLEQARDLLASYLDDRGCHIEAENVRKGIDLESYENELKLVGWMYRHTRLAQAAQAVDVDSLAQEIRRVDGMHMLGASALAEALMPFITNAIHAERARGPAVTFDMVKEAEFFCPTDLPTLKRLRWKAKRLTELLAAAAPQPESRS